MPKLCPNIRFLHQQDFFPIRSVTKSSTARFSHENLVEKFKIFVQDFVPIRTALRRKSEISPRKSSKEKIGDKSAKKRKKREVSDCLDEYVPNHVSNFEVQIKKNSPQQVDITISNGSCSAHLVLYNFRHKR